jgi:predicted PurR-regulated permease PerM
MSTQERVITISIKTILQIILTLVVLTFLWAIRDILALVFAALILAALMNPFAKWAEKYKVPRGVSVLLFYVLVFGGVAFAVSLALPQLVDQLGSLSTVVGKSWDVLAGGIESLRQFTVTHGLTENVQAGVSGLQGQGVALLEGAFSTLTGLFGSIAGLIVVLVMAYYMVVQEVQALRWFQNLLPDSYQNFTTHLLTRVQEKFGRWLIGQLSLCIIIGVVYYIGLRLIGVEGALVLAILGGFTEFIPYLGPILGAIPGVFAALSESPAIAIATAIFYVAVQQLEGHVLVPKIMQKAVGLNPVVSIVALLVGGKLFGMAGAILAIPVTTACSVVIMELYAFQQKQES